MKHAPKHLLRKRKKGQSKIKCDDCGNLVRVRHVIRLKGKFLCTNCKNKLLSYRLQASASSILNSPARKSLKKALSQIYEIHGYLLKDNRIIGVRSFPQVLIGRKVKLRLVK